MRIDLFAPVTGMKTMKPYRLAWDALAASTSQAAPGMWAGILLEIRSASLGSCEKTDMDGKIHSQEF